jgi:hypothetical protein
LLSSSHRAMLMIGVPTHGFIFGHSMPPTLPKSLRIEDIQKNVIKKNISKFYKYYIYQKIIFQYL